MNEPLVTPAVTTSGPGRGTGWLQAPLGKVLRPMINRICDIEITGMDNLPSTGPALIAPNHLSFIDSAFLMALVERPMLAVGKAEYMDSWKTKHLFPACGMIPLDRSGGKASQAALGAAAGALRAGNLFLIYPEGTRTRDGYLHRGRTGLARLAMETGAPIVPVGLVGTDRVQPPGARTPKLKEHCEIHIGQPIDVTRYQGKPNRRLLYRQITDEVMFEIGELSGQTYVDVYSGEPLPEAQPPASSTGEARTGQAKREPAMTAPRL